MNAAELSASRYYDDMEHLYANSWLRDFAVGHPVAGHMQNFVYLIGTESPKSVIVDPAWAVDERSIAQNDGMKVVGALGTHYHPDHIGGTAFGFTVEGLPRLMEINPCPVHVHKAEADGVIQITGLSRSDLVVHESNDVGQVGEVDIEWLHTPGHTPGSQCCCVKTHLIAGDTCSCTAASVSQEC